MIIVIKLKKSGSPADKGTKTKRLPPGLINGSSLGTEQFLPWN